MAFAKQGCDTRRETIA